MKTKTKELFHYHIFPPFIDAYLNSLYLETPASIDQIKEMMFSHSNAWAFEVVGRCYLECKEMPRYNENLVLCCAYLYDENKNPNKKYLVIVKELGENWYDKLEFIEGEILNEWDVT